VTELAAFPEEERNEVYREAMKATLAECVGRLLLVCAGVGLAMALCMAGLRSMIASPMMGGVMAGVLVGSAGGFLIMQVRMRAVAKYLRRKMGDESEETGT
jgi:hypothetical protein